MHSPVILSRTPFRLPLGGGSTDLPSYYQKYGGFIFAVTINLYMDLFIKRPVSDDCVHMHYMKSEAVLSADEVKHTIGREALRMLDIKNRVLVFFAADTPSGTGLGSSGACAVGLLKGLSLYKGRKMSNLEAAEQSFVLTQNLGLPDGKQDPYVCALGGFVVLLIDCDGKVVVEKPFINPLVEGRFIENTLFFYTGVRRDSEPILSSQNKKSDFDLKHEIKTIGKDIHRCFLNGDLDRFGELLDEHWNIKKAMSNTMSNESFDAMYHAAKKAGASGGKILGAGGGGYFMFYCRSSDVKNKVRKSLQEFNLREMSFSVERNGARAKIIQF